MSVRQAVWYEAYVDTHSYLEAQVVFALLFFQYSKHAKKCTGAPPYFEVYSCQGFGVDTSYF